FHHGGDHRAVEEWVFAEGLLGSPPTGVAGQVGIGRTNHEVAAVGLLALQNVPGFISLDAASEPDERRVPGFAHAYLLRELRRRDGSRPSPSTGPAQGQPVQTFRVARSANVQARHAGVSPQTGD